MLDLHAPTLTRDLGFFLVLFAVALALGLGAPAWLRYVAAVGFVLSYAVYVRLTLHGGGGVQESESLKPLYLDTSRGDPPTNGAIVLQLFLALGAIVGGSHLFVEELLHVADRVGVSPLVLALVLAPLATELPEKANSFLWTREGKDTLALGNISGAMVFQSTMPVALGLAFSGWALSGPRSSLRRSAWPVVRWRSCCCASAAVSACLRSWSGLGCTRSSSPTSPGSECETQRM